jgi:pimeloyl-ACP methyl ester carboxylesterase
MRHLIAILLAGASFTASTAAADDRAVVFIHGLGSSSHTWDEAVSRLTPQLAIQPVQPDLEWRAWFEVQATELEQKLGSQLPADAVAVGHSNGGIVARQWSRTRGVGSLITLGSPNQGVPFVDHLFEWFAYLDDILNRISNVGAVFSITSQDVWWWLPAQWLDTFNFGVDVWNTAGNGLVSLGFDYTLPIMPEMRVGSSYMGNLNSQSNRDAESSAVPARVAIVDVARDFDVGGPFRVVSPGNYEAWHVGINIAGIALEGLAGVIRITANVQDQTAFDLADRVSAVAEWFLQFEEIWCRTVSDPSPYPIARCMEHDGIVPAWSQAYDFSRLPLIVRVDGPIHTRETADSDEQLYQALTTIAGVARRQDASVPPPDPTVEPPPATEPPPPPPPSGRFKLIDGQCVWDATDSGPDQCSPLPPPGRYKFDGWGTCYWEPNDYPPDQCSPPAPPTGRFKLDGSGGCYWDPNDSGPDQCAP